MFIEIKNICKSFKVDKKKLSILKGVSFGIEFGEFVGIVGSSGSGKSTLLYILGLLDDADSGYVILNNENVSVLKEEEKTRIRLKYMGYVFQDFYLLEELNLFENVALSGLEDGMEINDAHKRAKELLIRVGLKKELYKKPTQLSGGQKQRVAIARALMNRPLILFADEPTANLDSRTSREIINLFKELNRQSKLTVIMVTHEDEFKTEVDKLVEIKDGEILKIVTNKIQ